MYYDSDRSESPLPLPEHSSLQGPANHSMTAAGNGSAYGAAVAMNPLPPALAAAPDMMSLLRALKRHWLLATTLGLLACTAASVAVWYFMPLKYTAEAVLRINMTKLVKVGLDEKEGASPFTPQTLASLAKARFVVRKALEEQEVAKLPSIREQLEPVEWLRRRLEVGFISPELLSISLTGSKPRELEALVNAVAGAYQKQLDLAERDIRQVRVRKLDAIVTKLQGVVNNKKGNYRRLVEDTGVTNSMQRQIQAQFDQMRLDRLLKEELDEQHKLERAQLELERTKDRKTPRIPMAEIMRAVKDSKSVQALNSEIEKLEEDLAKAESVFNNKNHPALQERREKIRKKRDELRNLEKKLIPEVRQQLVELRELLGPDSVEDIKDDIALTERILEHTNEAIKEVGNKIKKQGPESLELEERRAEFEAEESVLKSLRQTLAAWRAEWEESSGSTQVQDPAVAVGEQFSRKQIMMAGGAGTAALGLVLLAFAYWEFRLRRLNTVEDVVYGLGWRLVGQLPALPERSRGGLLRKRADPRYWQSLMTESVDAARTMILHAARLEGIRTVMVTSAVSGEGKTSLSCHLACSLARAGRKTLLLDCDLRNPAAHRLFELPGEPGFCEVLRGEAQLADVIRATPANNLWLIPAGQFDEQALQALTLSQAGFSPLLEQLKTQFDFIVVDSSPVLPVVDTLVIGQNMDVVVFSLLRDVSRIPSVYAAYQRLATLDIRILGAVVNGVDAGSYGYAPQYSQDANQPA